MTGFMGILTQDILVTIILMSLIALVGIIGNALMLRALIVYPRLRTDFYTVFGFLGVVDSLFLIISVPAHIMEMVLATSVTTDFWCKSSHYMINTCGFIAAYLMVVLAILRGILLTNRNFFRHPKASHLLIVCFLISVITIMCSIPIVFIFSSHNGDCYYADIDHQKYRYVWLISSFSAFIPLAIVLLIFMLTYILAKRYFSDSYSPTEREKSCLVTNMLIAFTICQIPYRIFVIYELDKDQGNDTQLNKLYTIKNYLMCLVMADKAVRPILYSKLASDLSEAFDEVINCTYCAKHYSMGSRFGRTSSVHTTPPLTTTSAVTACNDSTENNHSYPIDRTVSSFLDNSVTSQTPLTIKDDDIEMRIDILES